MKTPRAKKATTTIGKLFQLFLKEGKIGECFYVPVVKKHDGRNFVEYAKRYDRLITGEHCLITTGVFLRSRKDGKDLLAVARLVKITLIK